MKRYFFDLVGRQRSEYDYRGHLLSDLHKVRQLAELMALDLGVQSESQWSGWSIAVRNAQGQQFLSVAVDPDCVAA
jgi:hypothetical protein